MIWAKTPASEKALGFQARLPSRNSQSTDSEQVRAQARKAPQDLLLLNKAGGWGRYFVVRFQARNTMHWGYTLTEHTACLEDTPDEREG